MWRIFNSVNQTIDDMVFYALLALVTPVLLYVGLWIGAYLAWG